MATIQFKKGDEYLFKISKLSVLMKTKVCGEAIHGAAKIVTDEIRKELEKVPTDERWGTPEHPAKGPRKVELQSIAGALGIAKMQEDWTGYFDVKIGFDGYNGVRTKRWPKGQPIQMIARSIERGTSFMEPNPFVKRAAAATRKKAIDHMKRTIDAEIKNIMEG